MEKLSKDFLAAEGDIYSSGELCDEIQYAQLWSNYDSARNHIDQGLDYSALFEVVKVAIEYSIGDKNFSFNQ